MDFGIDGVTTLVSKAAARTEQAAGQSRQCIPFFT